MGAARNDYLFLTNRARRGQNGSDEALQKIAGQVFTPLTRKPQTWHMKLQRASRIYLNLGADENYLKHIVQKGRMGDGTTRARPGKLN